MPSFVVELHVTGVTFLPALAAQYTYHSLCSVQLLNFGQTIPHFSEIYRKYVDELYVSHIKMKTIFLGCAITTLSWGDVWFTPQDTWRRIMEDAPLKGGALTRMILKNPVQFKVISFRKNICFLRIFTGTGPLSVPFLFRASAKKARLIQDQKRLNTILTPFNTCKS